MLFFPKTGSESCSERNFEYESKLYNSTEQHPENFKIKLYFFQEKLSLGYNINLKLLSLFHIYKN